VISKRGNNLKIIQIKIIKTHLENKRGHYGPGGVEINELHKIRKPNPRDQRDINDNKNKYPFAYDKKEVSCGDIFFKNVRHV
jgi:hypothetical protein